MTTVSDNNSDESEEEVESTDDDIYRRKYQLLLERCEVLQQDNERLVHRTQQVKQLLRRGRRDRKLLMERLDKHGDNWRNIPISFELEEMLGFHQTKPAHHGVQRMNYNSPNTGSAKVSSGTDKPVRKANSGGNAGTKRKAPKGADSSAPKRRANSNTQYNQDLRPLVVASSGQSICGNSSEVDPNSVELSRQLTMKWNSIPQEEKKVFL